MNDRRDALPPVTPEALVRSLWQVAVYVMGALLVGSWIWVWNTNNALRDLQATLARLPEVVLRAEANRTVIDSYSERIAKLEESSRLSRDDRGRLHDQGHELRVALEEIRAALSSLQHRGIDRPTR